MMATSLHNNNEAKLSGYVNRDRESQQHVYLTVSKVDNQALIVLIVGSMHYLHSLSLSRCATQMT